ncbi:MAG: VOC family protein [Acidobacteriota bacterium]|jgi:catechol 2,3-dioxygenase-like lactoylglutathione lyase family enzyme
MTPDRLLETFLVVDDLTAARAFYEGAMGLEPFGEPDDRGCLFRLPGDQLLGLVDRTAARRSNRTPGGTVPACIPEGARSHGPSAHLAFAVSDLAPWRERLTRRGVELLEEIEWERGGRSLYFRDPDGNLLELATPGVWEIY